MTGVQFSLDEELKPDAVLLVRTSFSDWIMSSLYGKRPYWMVRVLFDLKDRPQWPTDLYIETLVRHVDDVCGDFTLRKIKAGYAFLFDTHDTMMKMVDRPMIVMDGVSKVVTIEYRPFCVVYA